MIKKQPLIIS